MCRKHPVGGPGPLSPVQSVALEGNGSIHRNAKEEKRGKTQIILLILPSLFQGGFISPLSNTHPKECEVAANLNIFPSVLLFYLCTL